MSGDGEDRRDLERNPEAGHTEAERIERVSAELARLTDEAAELAREDEGDGGTDEYTPGTGRGCGRRAPRTRAR